MKTKRIKKGTVCKKHKVSLTEETLNKLEMYEEEIRKIFGTCISKSLMINKIVEESTSAPKP